MEDFATILQRDYGLKPQGKSAPMTAIKNTAGIDITGTINRSGSVGRGKSSGGSGRSSKSSTPIIGESLHDDLLFGGNAARPSSRSTLGSGAGDLLGGASVAYRDVFGGPPQYSSSSLASQSPSMQNYDDIFGMPTKVSTSGRGSSLPLFDAPVFDDDIFGGVPGVRNASVAYDDVFNGGSGAGSSPAAFEDLLGGFGVMETKPTASTRTSSQRTNTLNLGESLTGDSVYDELLPGFGNIDSAKARSADAKHSQRAPLGIINDSPQKAADKPFVVLDADPVVSGGSTVPLSDLNPFNISSRPPSASSTKASMNGLTDGIPGFGDVSSPVPPISAESTNKSASTFRDPLKRSETDSPSRSAFTKESSEAKSVRRNHAGTNFASDQGKPSTNGVKFDVDASVDKSEEATTGSPSRKGQQLRKMENVTLKAEEPRQLTKVEKKRNVDEFWITVNDVKLATQPSTVPPPSRSPPIPGSRPTLASKKQEGSQDGTSNLNESHQQPGGISWQTSKATVDPGSKEVSNTSNMIDELEEFASGGSRSRKEGNVMASSVIEDEQVEGSAAVAASTAAMKDALERAEAKLKQARETRDRDRERDEREREAKLAKLREERERAREAREKEEREQAIREAHEREEKERLAHETYEREEKEKAAREAREREESERVSREREDREREARSAREAHEREEKEREEREREVRERRRKEREKEKEREREREKDRIAVERATQEARERAEARALAEARERAERAAVERATAEARERAAADARERAAERAAVERAALEARARAERAAVERANAEARERAAEKASAERAAAEARERAERAATEKAAAERAVAEARERAERAAAEKAAAERAVAEARERAERAAAERAAAAQEQQRRNENDLDSFFMANSRASSAPRQRPAAVDTLFETRQTNNKAFSSEGQKNSFGAPGVRKVASTDDFASLFGVPPSDEFQHVDGELPERRRARLERHQRTLERAAKALEEKNQRDIQSQRDQAERHRAAEMLDAEIKRWAAGKEGNLRALLSTLQYVLWPECGWQAVSLTELIAGASVKKVYRKATLCVHPDKVQQKGATIQQKYIAEKVFDLLKEAWNKFNSEELF